MPTSGLLLANLPSDWDQLSPPLVFRLWSQHIVCVMCVVCNVCMCDVFMCGVCGVCKCILL